MRKSKWRARYDSCYGGFEDIAISWDDFMMMPEAIRESKQAPTPEGLENENPRQKRKREFILSMDNEEFVEMCVEQREELYELKAVYERFPKWFRDYMCLGDFLAIDIAERNEIIDLYKKGQLEARFADVYEKSRPQ